MKEYRINVDPRILELLGPNLYTNIYYVLAELIANSYDADADNVYIDATANEIRVEDDGRGMSYSAGDVEKYLNVAGVSRTTQLDAVTPKGRAKMGRKGVGKLAALSVSKDVEVLTISQGERSGFVLSRRPTNGNRLVGIPDDSVVFNHVAQHGSAIVMRDPQYTLHKTIAAVRRNILKLFPLVSKSFRIHVNLAGAKAVIDSLDKSVMSELSSLITLGDEFTPLGALVPNPYPDRRRDLVSLRPMAVIPVELSNVHGVTRSYDLEIRGWIGTYASTRGRKAEMTDFPDNFISLFANGKLGEFNILPIVGQNKLSEAYVVGQLHVDLFELTELPDMALSNRQGYKSDDARYQAVLNYVRDTLLSDIRKRRDIFVDLGKSQKKNQEMESRIDNERKLRASVDAFRKNASASAASALKGASLGDTASTQDLERIISDSLNMHSPDLGLKSTIDSQKKRILISQTYLDKPFSDVISGMLVHNGVPIDDILYTNSDNEVCRIPEGRKVYEYLREFFVESYSSQRIFVLFITSENTSSSWGAISEVGASWITQVDHKIFNIRPFRPEHPLDDESQWQSTNRDPGSGELWMDGLNADILCQKIETVCRSLGYNALSRQENIDYLDTLVAVRR